MSPQMLSQTGDSKVPAAPRLHARASDGPWNLEQPQGEPEGVL